MNSDQPMASAAADFDLAFELQLQEAIKLSSTVQFSSSSNEMEEIFRVYFKGLVMNEIVTNIKMKFAGIGVAIFNPNGFCVCELGYSFLVDAIGGGNKSEGEFIELKALIEAMDSAANIGVKRLHVFSDNDSVYQYLTGTDKPTNNKIMKLVHQFNLIQKNFAHCEPRLESTNNMEFIYKLAIDAIRSESTKWADSTCTVTLVEQCKICFEYLNTSQMFSINKCLHRFCFSCMRKHVEAKLLQGKLAECPHENCKSKIEIESCKKFLNPKLHDMISVRVKEASIPPEERIYCPYSDCSNLMSKTEVQEYNATSGSTSVIKPGMRKCVKCNRAFCIDCNVPWHDNITCSDYMKSSRYKSSSAAKLKSLATKKHWRQCIKCKNIIELAKGCYHIYCRCGYEFCYTCGAQWINKTPTYKCPIWDERNIIDTRRQRMN
ncbi:E3 ubiquitin-protein ligase RSL1-like [Rutidosis leptorrhynchoides]|uniref:E3 ubiquitin-protein ligase RSL1-like n=1 Tax=Rutidosis leptorrhynchoides TaxID=125765 RepID=UPI003A99F4DB